MDIKQLIESLFVPHEELTEERARAGCFVPDMPNEAYHQYPGISNSGLSKLAISPAHYKAGSFKSSRAMVVGSAIHAALLENDVFTKHYMMMEPGIDRRSSEYKQAAKAYGDDFVLTGTESEHVRGMIAAVTEHKKARIACNQDGWRELSAFIGCPETGVIMRCRFDLLTADGNVVDVKKTRDARASEFAKSMASYRYHVQEAMYRDVFKLITGKDIGTFEFLAIEEGAPHTIALYHLGDGDRQIGDQLYREGIQKYKECVANDSWPKLDESGLIELPYWYVSQFEDDVIDGLS